MTFLAFMLVPTLASAAPGDVAPKEVEEVKAASVPSTDAPGSGRTVAVDVAPAALAEQVRGLFVEARVGGGYMVASATIPADPYYPTLEGDSDGLGAGTIVGAALGYDLTDMIALQAVGGMSLVSSRRVDEWVRDLALVFGGAGLRLAIDLGERLDWVSMLGGGYASANNGVEPADTGGVVFGGTGIEYYVRVRHFSVGLQLSVLAPLNPSRVFVSLEPTLKYSF